MRKKIIFFNIFFFWQIHTIKAELNSTQTEWQKPRELVNRDETDRCLNLNTINFANNLVFLVSKMLTPQNAYIDDIQNLFGVKKIEHLASLVNHQWCHISQQTWSNTVGKKNPDNSSLDKMNQYIQNLNTLINNPQQDHMLVTKHLSKLFICLGYIESLSAPDTKQSKKVARKYSPKDYQRPSGVQFYEDPYQDKESRLNIGIFQFTPNALGNIHPCIRSWNENFPQCHIEPGLRQSEMIKILGSSLQSFNMFCGIHKLIETFTIQLNTENANSTHPDNINSSKKERCVSPYFSVKNAYNHFGPFQNSTGENFKELTMCLTQLTEKDRQ